MIPVSFQLYGSGGIQNGEMTGGLQKYEVVT